MWADGWINGETVKTERALHVFIYCTSCKEHNNIFILPYNNKLVKVSALALRIYKMEANKKNACASNEK
jgi:hypothetical protein